MDSKSQGQVQAEFVPKANSFCDCRTSTGQWSPILVDAQQNGQVSFFQWAQSESQVTHSARVPLREVCLAPFRTHTKYDNFFDYFLMEVDLRVSLSKLREEVKTAITHLPETREDIVQFYEGRLPWAIKRLASRRTYPELQQTALNEFCESLSILFAKTIDVILDSYRDPNGTSEITASLKAVWPALMMMVSAVTDVHSYMPFNPLLFMYEMQRGHVDFEHQHTVTHQISSDFQRVGIMRRWKTAYETPGIPFKHLIMIPVTDMCKLIPEEERDQYYRETLSAFHRRWQTTRLEEYSDISYAELLEISRSVRFFIDHLEYGYNDGLYDLQASILHSIRLQVASRVESEQVKGLSFLTHIMDLDFTNGRDWTMQEITQIAHDSDMVRSSLLGVVSQEGAKVVRKLLHYMIAEEQLNLVDINPLPDMRNFMKPTIFVSMMEHRMWKQLAHIVDSGYSLSTVGSSQESKIAVVENALKYATPAPLLIAIVNDTAELRPAGCEFLAAFYEEKDRYLVLRKFQPDSDNVIQRVSAYPSWNPSPEVRKMLVYYSVYRFRLFILSLVERNLTTLALLPYDLQFLIVTEHLS